MTRPITSSRFLLVEDRRATDEAPPAVPLRRYRLARLHSDERGEREDRFEYLKRPHD